MRIDAPTAAIVASSCRRSASATVTNNHIAPAARAIANAFSMSLIPVRSTVVIELTVWTVWSRMFFTTAPSRLVTAATRRDTAGGSPLDFANTTLAPPAWSAACR